MSKATAYSKRLSDLVGEMDKLCRLPGRLIAMKGIPPAVLRELKGVAVGSVPELAYLRICMGWETFIETTFTNCITSRPAVPHGGTLVEAPFRHERAALNALLNGRDFVSWSNIEISIQVFKRFVDGGVHERVLSSNMARLRAFFDIRHRIAHRSNYSQDKFERATMELCGKRYKTAGAAEFLLEADRSFYLPQDWFATISQELVLLAKQISPK